MYCLHWSESIERNSGNHTQRFVTELSYVCVDYFANIEAEMRRKAVKKGQWKIRFDDSRLGWFVVRNIVYKGNSR